MVLLQCNLPRQSITCLRRLRLNHEVSVQPSVGVAMQLAVHPTLGSCKYMWSAAGLHAVILAFASYASLWDDLQQFTAIVIRDPAI